MTHDWKVIVYQSYYIFQIRFPNLLIIVEDDAITVVSIISYIRCYFCIDFRLRNGVAFASFADTWQRRHSELIWL